MNPILLFIVNDAGFFLSHRLPIAEQARASGYQVHVATMPGAAVGRIRELGFVHHPLPLSRNGRNPLAELGALYAIWALCWRLKPAILHLVTIKPVLYGGIAARLSPVGGVVAAVSGLGFVFLSEGWKARATRQVVRVLYRLALGKENLRVIFQNPDDRQALVGLGAVRMDKTALIKGSGVELTTHLALPEPEGVPVVTFAARLLRDKGVVEYVEAARLLRRRGVEARFQLVGDPDVGNPTSVSPHELEEWRREGVVEVVGHRKDIAKVFALSHLVVLPSYREGLPKVLVEAAACGRAIVTTDVPGCRDAVEPGSTGLLVQAKDPVALADAIERLVCDTALRKQMGAQGRRLAERDFAIERIVGQHLAIYRQLQGGGACTTAK